MTELKHGIAIRNRESKQLIEFIECPTGRSALRVLSGVRHNLNHEEYKAEETYVKISEIARIKK